MEIDAAALEHPNGTITVYSTDVYLQNYSDEDLIDMPIEIEGKKVGYVHAIDRRGDLITLHCQRERSNDAH